MAEEPVQRKLGPKKRLTKSQAISVMATGGVMLVLPWFFPIAEGSSLSVVKTIVSAIGFVILCLGSYYRP
jgi:hypothetical protein